jgi:hypothetical protein
MINDDEKGKLILLGIAAIGGMLSYTSRCLRENKPIRLLVASVRIMTAVMVAYAIMMVCTEYHISSEMTSAIIAISSLLGADITIPLIETCIRRRLGIDDIDYFRSPYTGNERRARKERKSNNDVK